MSHRSSRDLVRGPSQGEKVGRAEARVGKDCCRTGLRGGEGESGLGIRHSIMEIRGGREERESTERPTGKTKDLA